MPAEVVEVVGEEEHARDRVVDPRRQDERDEGERVPSDRLAGGVASSVARGSRRRRGLLRCHEESRQRRVGVLFAVPVEHLRVAFDEAHVPAVELRRRSASGGTPRRARERGGPGSRAEDGPGRLLVLEVERCPARRGGDLGMPDPASCTGSSRAPRCGCRCGSPRRDDPRADATRSSDDGRAARDHAQPRQGGRPPAARGRRAPRAGWCRHSDTGPPSPPGPRAHRTANRCDRGRSRS